MKILHCLNSPKIGGIERLVIDLAIEQRLQGINVVIMLDSFDGQYLKNIKKHNIKTIASGIKSGYDISLFKLINLYKQFKQFDIIHFHHFSSIKCAAAIFSKTVYTIHGLSKGVRKENCIKFYIRESIKHFFINKVSIIVANSKYTLKQAKRHYDLINVKSEVVLNGVHIINYINNPKTKNEFTIGLVSRFVERKRIDRLVSAFNYFIKSGAKGKLVLVGDGKTFENIKLLINKYKLEEYVDLTGYKTNVSDFYDLFDICVFPSEKEPFGLVAVESYFFGKPVLVFKDSGGLKEIVSPIEPKNVVDDELELSERMIYYYKNKRMIYEKSAKRQSYAKDFYSIQKMERNYFKVYNCILKT